MSPTRSQENSVTSFGKSGRCRDGDDHFSGKAVDLINLVLSAIIRASILTVGEGRNINTINVAHLPGINKRVHDEQRGLDVRISVWSKETDVWGLGIGSDTILIDSFLTILKVEDVFHLHRKNRNIIKVRNIHEIAGSWKSFDNSRLGKHRTNLVNVQVCGESASRADQ